MRAHRVGAAAPRAMKAITATRLNQAVYTQLRNTIVNHDYAPGERLQVDQLATQLGVSRTPVREALNLLASEGLVEVRPRHGTFVAQVDDTAVAELYQMRLMIDTSVGKLLPPRLSPRQLQILKRALDKLRRLTDGDTYRDYGAYLACDRAFHSTIVQQLGNSRLTALYEEINLPLWLVRAQQSAGTPQDARVSFAEHEAIFAALQARDPRAAAEAMAGHIESSLRKLGARVSPADHHQLVDLPI